MLRQPPVLAGLLYSWVTAVGFAHLFGTGLGIGVNVIDLASTSDFLTSGLRDPFVTLLALASGCGLFTALGIAVKRRSHGLPVFASALALLVAGAILSGWYRRSVTTGELARHVGSPCPLEVTVQGVKEPLLGRLGATTSDFLILVQDEARSVVLPRGNIQSMQVDCAKRTSP